jgi:hydroxyethylthiazole kinase-like uncharacterized protein yjeF
MKNITEGHVKNWLPVRDKNTYKNKMGHVLCIGGNKNMGGAIILSASAALYSGAGLVSVASAPENLHALHARLPEAMFLDMYNEQALTDNIKKADVVVIGPGLGLSNQSLKVFKQTLQALNEDQQIVIDGDAITHFANEEPMIQLPAAQIILTPHAGEWERLTNIQPPADDQAKNQQQKDALKATIVLKKAQTEIYIEDDIWQNIPGNPSMATGGMGDTLTGIIASFLGQFENNTQGLLSAVYIHSAVANELADTHYVTLPSAIIDYLPIFMKNFEL